MTISGTAVLEAGDWCFKSIEVAGDTSGSNNGKLT
jgi:hypothetical protein